MGLLSFISNTAFLSVNKSPQTPPQEISPSITKEQDIDHIANTMSAWIDAELKIDKQTIQDCLTTIANDKESMDACLSSLAALKNMLAYKWRDRIKLEITRSDGGLKALFNVYPDGQSYPSITFRQFDHIHNAEDTANLLETCVYQMEAMARRDLQDIRKMDAKKQGPTLAMDNHVRGNIQCMFDNTAEQDIEKLLDDNAYAKENFVTILTMSVEEKMRRVEHNMHPIFTAFFKDNKSIEFSDRPGTRGEFRSEILQKALQNKDYKNLRDLASYRHEGLEDPLVHIAASSAKELYTGISKQLSTTQKLSLHKQLDGCKIGNTSLAKLWKLSMEEPINTHTPTHLGTLLQRQISHTSTLSPIDM